MNLTTYSKFDQGTDLWLLARLGLPTASCFKTVMAKGVGRASVESKAESKTRRRYLWKLGAELMTGNPTPTYKSPQMERGNQWERDALLAYVQRTGYKIDKVAFVRNNPFMIGASPDALIGNDGGVEVKTMEQDLFYGFLEAPGVPSEHMAQIQGLMWVTDRQWWDLAIYCPGFELYVERVGRSSTYIEEMQRYVTAFQEELAAGILQRTGETIQTWRKRRDDQLHERFMEWKQEEGDDLAPEEAAA